MSSSFGNNKTINSVLPKSVLLISSTAPVSPASVLGTAPGPLLILDGVKSKRPRQGELHEQAPEDLNVHSDRRLGATVSMPVNLHISNRTRSVIHGILLEYVVEAAAVFIQLAIGFCANIAAVTNKSHPDTSWIWGSATMIATYLSGNISRAHLNSSITIVLWFYRGFPKRKVPRYLGAQFLGAFLAAIAAYSLCYQSIERYLTTSSENLIVSSFVAVQYAVGIGPATVFITEFMGALFLAVMVLAVDDKSPSTGMRSIIFGLVVVCLHAAFASQTGAVFNPSRDLGTRLALLALGYDSDLFRNVTCLCWSYLGSISGALIGGLLYDLVFVL